MIEVVASTLTRRLPGVAFTIDIYLYFIDFWKMKVLRSRELFQSTQDVNLGYFMAFPSFTQMHKHDFYEVFLIGSGSIIHQLEGNKQEPLFEGAVVFIRPNDAHGFLRHKDDDCYLINAAFPPGEFKRVLRYIGRKEESHPLLQNAAPPSFALSAEERLHLTNRLETLQQLGKPEQLYTFRGILADIISRYFTPSQTIATRMPEWITLLCARMRQKENFLQGISQMQKLAGCSPEHLSRSFKKHLNMTPSQFINQLRLNFSGSLLQNTSMPVIEVAYESGFENLSHFNHLFKNKFRQTPLQYRSNRQKYKAI